MAWSEGKLIGRRQIHAMTDIAVGARPAGAAIARILGNGSIGPAVAADVVAGMRPSPVAEEVETAAETLLETGLHRREERVARAFEPRDTGDARVQAEVGTAGIDGSGSRIGLVDVARP